MIFAVGIFFVPSNLCKRFGDHVLNLNLPASALVTDIFARYSRC